MLNLIVANLCDILDTTLYGLSANCKNKKNIIFVQSIGVLLNLIACILVKTPIGVALAFVTLGINAMIYLDLVNKVTIYGVIVVEFIATVIVLLISAKDGIWGILLPIGDTYYTIMSFVSKDKKQMCIAICLYSVIYAPYQFSLKLYFGGIISAITVITAFINYRKELLSHTKGGDLLDNA